MKAFVWAAYDKEPPFLPVAIADRAKDLAKLVGTTENTVTSTWSKYITGRIPASRFYRVKVG